MDILKYVEFCKVNQIKRNTKPAFPFPDKYAGDIWQASEWLVVRIYDHRNFTDISNLS